MKRIENIFKIKKNILNIYTTAGFPKLEDTIEIVQELAKNGVDMIEIGMPFSDPLADGPTIQNSSQIAIKNGITLDLIFEQIKTIRQTVEIPIILMGYYNQILKYGDIQFFKKAKTVGVDGFIIPDLPLNIYQIQYKIWFQKLELDIIFLITPQTTNKRIQLIDNESSGFIYLVSSFATTGSKSDIKPTQLDYFNRVSALKLNNPRLIGFGISNKNTFDTACQNAEGAIIGSAFITAIEKSKDLKIDISKFVKAIL
jgi:tryptophan synthase alpha chain